MTKTMTPEAFAHWFAPALYEGLSPLFSKAEAAGYERGLEDAAKVAAEWEKHIRPGEYVNVACERVAFAIRALKEKKPSTAPHTPDHPKA